MKTLAYNKRAKFDYQLLETFEAGLKLIGNEVKSIKTGRASLKGAYVTVHKNELYLINAHVPHYQNHVDTNYDPDRSRKLLMHRKEIDSLIGKKSASGLTIVPVRIYLKKGRIKLEISLAKGKKEFDKRHSIREREESRDMQRKLKNF